MKKKNLLLSFLIGAGLAISLALAGVIVVHQVTQPVDSTQPAVTQFVVPKGQSVSEIGQRLEQKELIKNAMAFRAFVTLQKQGKNIQAGSFELSPSMSLFTVISSLTEGTNDVWVTIPEGLRREEIAQSLTKYDLAVFDQEQFLNQTVGLEGRLFPDTYLLPKMIETQAIITLLSQTFETKVTTPLQPKIEQTQFNFEEILIMASLVEREARGLEQMRQVAGVLYKRLELGMALQVDATLQYAKGYNPQTDKWWNTPTRADKKIDSPFNTYLKPGLPPHPICNPGLEAIQAALDPASTNYLYYLHDNQGRIHFAQTLDQHNQNVNKYLR
ncbi:MAG: endolytic transglycosylase MltG [Candidatus Pacebacteria bacterium]|nr:endolytic transglycosylase MltG [Candidatus Paceibacterota bacterium]